MLDEEIRAASIVIVDDDPAGLRLLERVLTRAGHTGVRATTRSGEALELVDRVDADLLVVDLQMPFPDGFALLDSLRNARADRADYLPVLVLTGDTTMEARKRALVLGASDFLAKPYDPMEVRCRIRNLLHARILQRRLAAHSEELEREVERRTRELQEARRELLDRLAHAAEMRDDETGRHTQRVGALAAEIARALGLPEARTEIIRQAAPLHDIGKLGVPDAVLRKAGALDERELTVMRTHAEIGARLLAGGDSELIRTAEVIARCHHERWDGNGYPDGLTGEQIPLAARIVAAADVYDALTHDRPYRPAWTEEQALELLRSERGAQFDPRVVDALLALREGAAGEAA